MIVVVKSAESNSRPSKNYGRLQEGRRNHPSAVRYRRTNRQISSMARSEDLREEYQDQDDTSRIQKERRYRLWGGGRDIEDALYIWARDTDEAFSIARKIDSKINSSQWTGEERTCR